MKGLKKVDAETGMIFTAYNFRRIINIIGIKNFIRKMRKVPGFLFFKLISALTTALQKINILAAFHPRTSPNVSF